MKPRGEIKFPCIWEFRLIVDGTMTTDVKAAAEKFDAEVQAGFTIADGEASQGGKYAALRLSCEVESLEKARELSAGLSKLPGVKFMI